MSVLNDILYQKVLQLSQMADRKLEAGAFKDAARMYLEGIAMLPTPLEQWDAATWLSGSAANALFLDRQFAAALTELRRALRMPGALDNPFIRLRLGQSLYEVGEKEEAQQELLKAYMLDGDRVFEDENPKYFKVIKAFI